MSADSEDDAFHEAAGSDNEAYGGDEGDAYGEADEGAEQSASDESEAEPSPRGGAAQHARMGQFSLSDDEGDGDGTGEQPDVFQWSANPMVARAQATASAAAAPAAAAAEEDDDSKQPGELTVQSDADDDDDDADNGEFFDAEALMSPVSGGAAAGATPSYDDTEADTAEDEFFDPSDAVEVFEEVPTTSGTRRTEESSQLISMLLATADDEPPELPTPAGDAPSVGVPVKSVSFMQPIDEEHPPDAAAAAAAVRTMLQARRRIDGALSSALQSESDSEPAQKSALSRARLLVTNTEQAAKSSINRQQYIEALEASLGRVGLQNAVPIPMETIVASRATSAVVLSQEELQELCDLVSADPQSISPDTPTRKQFLQDRKDIERDVVSVNGDAIAGRPSYTEVLDQVIDALLDADATLPQECATAAAVLLLRTVGRTMAGGDAFEAVMGVVGNPMVVMIAADAVNSAALEIFIQVGAHCGKWGLGAVLRTPMSFKLCDPNPTDNNTAVWDRLRVVLRREIAFSVAVTADTSESQLLVASSQAMHVLSDAGHITMQLAAPRRVPAARDGQTNAGADEDEEATAADDDANLATGGNLPAAGTESLTAAIAKGRDVPTIVGVYAWGKGEHGVLGTGDIGTRQLPHRLRFGTALGLARIKQISCSVFHNIAVTDVGLVYTWGNGGDGALGHGSPNSVAFPRLVEYFGIHNAHLVAAVAAGGDLLGSHSVAVTTEGRVYAWGLGTSIGINTMQSQLLPTLLASDTLYETGPIVAVSAGGGFTVALSEAGALFSWGKWANGRLGLGKAPVRPNQTRSIYKRQVPRFALIPRRLTKLDGVRIVSVACGDAHVVAVDSDGQLWSWGKGAQGQLGIGSLYDKLYPYPVQVRAKIGSSATDQPVYRNEEEMSVGGGSSVASSHYSEGSHSVAEDASSVASSVLSQSTRNIRFVSVAAGETHSAAIDSAGIVYVWGGGGSVCLGQMDSVPQTSRIPLSDAAHARAADRAKASGWKGRVGRRRPWLRPRKVIALTETGNRVKQVACGASHTVALCENGSLFGWGGNSNGELGMGPEAGAEITVPRQLGVAATTEWTRDGPASLADTMIQFVAACANHTLVLSHQSGLGRDMAAALFPDRASELLSTEESSLADCSLVVDRRSIPVHRAVLAARSEVLRRRIVAEEIPGRILELPLTDIGYDIAVMMLEFMYTDNISVAVSPMFEKLHELSAAAAEYQIAGLYKLCQCLLSSEASKLVRGIADEDMDLNQTEDDVHEVEGCVELQLLGDQLSQLLTDDKWADITFLTQGQEVHAHRVVLCSRSSYFKGLFLGGMQESLLPMEHMSVEIPDHPDCMRRLLFFMYSGKLADTSSDDLLEDMVAADRYDVHGMKALCESMLEVTCKNAARVYELADLVSALTLREKAMQTIVSNLGEVSCTPGFAKLQKRNPRLVGKIFERLAQREESVLGPIEEEEDGQPEPEKKEDPPAPFPWLSLLVVIICTFAYSSIEQLNVSFGWAAPTINVIALCVVLILGCRSLQK